MALRVWGSDVRKGSFGGHDGLTYEGLTYEGLTYDESPSTFEDLIAATEKWTDRTFLVHGDRRISFTEFRAAAASARRIVDDLDIRSGDRVMVFGYNSPEWVVALWALWLAGAVPVLAGAAGGVRPRSSMPPTCWPHAMCSPTRNCPWTRR